MYFIRIKNKNQYQCEQLIKFFKKLQTMRPFVRIFTNESFQNFTIFPVVKTTKGYGSWIAEVAILQELYFYSYRFFSNVFFIYQKDFELQIKLQFIQSYSSEKLKKKLSIQIKC